MTASSNSTQRFCLVTVGATVGFEALIKEVLNPAFWEHLSSRGFTNLRVQCGPDIPWASQRLASFRDAIPQGLSVDVFEVSKNLMKEEMVLCKAENGQRSQGLVISHAGTGTVLDAWKLGLPLVVVPNTQLLNDHQTEMARHLSKEGYATMSTGSRQDLQEAIHKSDLLREENQSRWPPNDPQSAGDSRVSIWEVFPKELAKEENAQMGHD